jgi:hypothetical protein
VSHGWHTHRRYQWHTRHNQGPCRSQRQWEWQTSLRRRRKMRTRYQARPRPTPQSRRRREKQREGEAGDGACDVKVVVAVLINAERDRGRERYGGAKTIARRRQKRVRGREETKAPENSRKKGGPFRSRRRFCLCVLFCSAAFSGKWWKRSSTAGSTERRDHM